MDEEMGIEPEEEVRTFRPQKLLLLVVVALLGFGGYVLFAGDISSSDDDSKGGESALETLEAMVETSKDVDPDQDAEIKLEDLVLKIPAGAVDEEVEVLIKEYDPDDSPDANQDTIAIGSLYELGPDGLQFDEDVPAQLSLGFDPDGLDDLEISTLHIAFWDDQDEEWMALDGSVIDIENQMITAPATHFSFYSVFYYIEEVIEELGEAVFGDIIEYQSRFSQLPEDLQDILVEDYDSDAFTGAIYWKVSHASKAASTTIAAANAISQLSGYALAAIDGGEEAVEWAVAEAIALAIGEQTLSTAAGEEYGTIAVDLYEAGKLGVSIANKGFKAIQESSAVQAEIAAWILAEEMEYINEHMDEGFKQLWQLNIASIERLEVYIITIDGLNETSGQHDTGVRYYYYNPSSSQYDLYYDNTVSYEVTVQLDNAAVVPMTGLIRGSLSFPASGIPPTMTVCAEPVSAGQEICTSTHLNDDSFVYGVGYELQVPADTYYVYAYVPGDSYRAYYNEMVTCGLMVTCTSHDLIDVAVNAGDVITGIDPGDWYDN